MAIKRSKDFLIVQCVKIYLVDLKAQRERARIHIFACWLFFSSIPSYAV